MSFEDSIRIHVSAHVRRLVQCGRAKRGNSLPCPQKTRPCHDVAKAAGLGWNWSPQCKYSTCLLALSGSRVSTCYKKIRKKSLRVNCEGCLAAWRRLSIQGWCRCRWAGQERAPWGSNLKGHPSAPPIPVESQTSRRGDEGQTQTYAFQSQQNWLVSHQSTNAATTQARNCAGTLNGRFSSWQWGNRGKGECREQGHQGHTHTHAHTPPWFLFVARKGMATKMIVKRYQVEPQTMDVDGDGATATHAYQKTVKMLTKMHPNTMFPPPPPLSIPRVVLPVQRGCCRACKRRVWEGQCQTCVTCGWAVGAGAEQGHCLSQCKSIPSSHGRGKKRSPNQRPKIRPKRRWLALPNPGCRSLRSKAKAGNPLRRPQSPRNPIRTRWPRLAERRAECF